MKNHKVFKYPKIKKDMSEELIKRGLEESGIKIGNYEYYIIGETTIKQLENAKIIPHKDYSKYNGNKPDGLLLDKRNKEDIIIIASIEYKKPSEFRTKSQQKGSIEQCNTMCQIIDAKIGIITDGQITFWINPKQENEDNYYFDEKKIKRSYSLIRNEDKKDLSENFIIQKIDEINYDKLGEDTKNTLDYIERILSCINENNSNLLLTEEVDPLPLANSVWQDIFINTGQQPEKCLYNVVELFIFKFLSDLGVLKRPNNFDFLFDMYKDNENKEVLAYYAKNCRKKIRELFPTGEDGTTIINGTIFVDTKGEPVVSQANLFKNSLIKYAKFGSLKNVKKEFKTKLFETFLKQSKDKKKLGQFFTPRKIVRAMVDMSNIENLPNGSRFCDPFCGVGGFICEPIHKTKRKLDFIPIGDEITPKITYHGFDKGSDDEQQRTIILAKANMLIYLSDILEKNPSMTKEFARVFNSTFHLFTDSNLGTLNRILKSEDEKYDLILTNPPYISSGKKSISDEIIEQNLEREYTKNGKGVEGLALEWIIRSLRKEGRAFVVIPLNILNVDQNKDLRDFILEECYLNCIISLPIKTFFNTPQKTFILGITKKNNKKEVQDFPVFTYLVSNIGETLDINRFEIEGKSDLEKAKDFFNMYRGSPSNFPIKEIGDKRCKLQPLSKFKEKWDIDLWWSEKEKIDLGINEEQQTLSLDEIAEKMQNLQEAIKNSISEINSLESKKKLKFSSKPIGDLFYFPKTNSKITKSFCNKHKGNIPVYASSKDEKSVLGFIKDNLKGVKYYSNCLSWNRNGSVGYVFLRSHKFATNEDHRAMVLKEEYEKVLNMNYLKFEIEKELFLNGFSYVNKCGVDKIKAIQIKIPINEMGKFSEDEQIYLLNKFEKSAEIKKGLKLIKDNVEQINLKLNETDNFKKIKITDIYNPIKITKKYTKKDIDKNKGDIPVYSSQSSNFGIIGYTNKAIFGDCSPDNTYITFGDHTRAVFIRDKPFSVSDNIKVLKLKEEYLGSIYEEYIIRRWNSLIPNLGYSRHWKIAKNINLEIPLNENKVFDINRQIEISNGLIYIENIKKNIIEKIEEIINAEVIID